MSKIYDFFVWLLKPFFDLAYKVFDYGQVFFIGLLAPVLIWTAILTAIGIEVPYLSGWYKKMKPLGYVILGVFIWMALYPSEFIVKWKTRDLWEELKDLLTFSSVRNQLAD